MTGPTGGEFLAALDRRIEATLDACTRCGACAAACPMLEPAGLSGADPAGLATGIADLLEGGEGAAEAVRWAEVCTNSGSCQPACGEGIDPRFMISAARMKLRARDGTTEPRRQSTAYFNGMTRGIRVLSKLQLAPEVLARVAPPRQPGEAAGSPPDIVFYTGCNVLKTPHILLLALDIMDAIGISYEVRGGGAHCCGVQNFRAGDGKGAGRFGFNAIERLAEPGAAQVVSWCPSCQVQIGEIALPAYGDAFGSVPFALDPFVGWLAERIDDLKPLFVHPVHRRVALAERPGAPAVAEGARRILGAIEGVEVVPIDAPRVGTMVSGWGVLPEHKKQLIAGELDAAQAAGVDTFATLFHACHREICHLDEGYSFEVLHFLELVGDAMGRRHEDRFKALKRMGEVDAVVTATADLADLHGLELDEVRDVVAAELFGGR